MKGVKPKLIQAFDTEIPEKSQTNTKSRKLKAEVNLENETTFQSW